MKGWSVPYRSQGAPASEPPGWRWALSLIPLLLFAALASGGAWRIEADRTTVRADGKSPVHLQLVAPSSVTGWLTPIELRHWMYDRDHAEALGLKIMPTHRQGLVLRAGNRGGMLRVDAVVGTEKVDSVQISLTPDGRDLDEDGLPDAAELFSEEDRAAFAAWFTTIAEAQATKIDDRWARVHQDCAGLVRFAFREALKRHDQPWLSSWKYLPAIDVPDVRGLRYPELPWLQDLPFRMTGGRFDEDMPLAQQFTAAASARTLWQHNSVFRSRNVADARAGDLLFFEVPNGTGSRMHTMIALGDRPGSSHHVPATRVVYHTGLTGEAGEVRLVSLAMLSQHPDPSWHPSSTNPRFLGVYRLAHVVHVAERAPIAFHSAGGATP